MARLSLVILLAGLFLSGCTLNQAPEATEIVAESTPIAERACNQIIESAMNNVGSICNTLGVNQACYGNQVVEVTFREGAAETFNAAGDVVALQSVQQLRTGAFNADLQQWGIALIKAQPNLPGTLPGQAVTFILYGDSQLDDVNPAMNSVTLRTGIGEVGCESAPPAAMLVQSPSGEQVTMTINGAQVTIASTIHIQAEAQQGLTVSTFEGRADITAFNETKSAIAGERVSMPVDVNTLTVNGPPSDPEPFEIVERERSFIEVIERQNTPADTPTPRPSPTGAGAQAGGSGSSCVVRADWTATYTIASGDTLSRIAQRAGITLDELQRGNCIDDPDRIAAGQVLRVPRSLQPDVTFTPRATSTQSPTGTPTSAPTATNAPAVGNPNLRADSTQISSGNCTTIRWDTVSQQMYFEGQPTRSNSREVCPTSTTTYTLLVVDSDGNQTPYRITINVSAALQEGSVCGNQICEPGEDKSCVDDCQQQQQQQIPPGSS
jgi:hypothetical protein